MAKVQVRGLTLMLFAEIHQNEGVLKTFQHSPDTRHVFPLTDLQTGVWTASRARLAQLLTNEHTATLVSYYYREIRDILNTVNNDAISDRLKDEFLSKDVEKAIKYGKAAGAHGAQYMLVEYDEYTDSVHDQFVEHARRLMEEESNTSG